MAGCLLKYSTHHQSKTHMRMIRTSDWKLVRDFLNPERDELFDLKNDPAESRNVIGQKKNAVVVRKLHTQILTRMKAVKDPILKRSNPNPATAAGVTQASDQQFEGRLITKAF